MAYIISLEGVDGCGKTTLRHALEARLKKLGKKVEVLQPTRTGDYGRGVLSLATASPKPDPTAELLLFLSLIRQFDATELRPRLEQDSFILLDRYIGSTYAYQVGPDGSPTAKALFEAALGFSGGWEPLTLPNQMVLIERDITECQKAISNRGDLFPEESNHYDRAERLVFSNRWEHYRTFVDRTPYLRGVTSVTELRNSATTSMEDLCDGVLADVPPELLG